MLSCVVYVFSICLFYCPVSRKSSINETVKNNKLVYVLMAFFLLQTIGIEFSVKIIDLYACGWLFFFVADHWIGIWE